MPVMTKTPKGDEIVILSRKEYDRLRRSPPLARAPASELRRQGVPPRVRRPSARLARDWRNAGPAGCRPQVRSAARRRTAGQCSDALARVISFTAGAQPDHRPRVRRT